MLNIDGRVKMRSIFKKISGVIRNNDSKNVSQSNEPSRPHLLNSCLYQNIDEIKYTLGNCIDLSIREFQLGKNNLKAVVIYIDGLVNKDYIQNYILKPLIIETNEILQQDELPEKGMLTFLINRVLTIGETKEVSDFDKLYHALLTGETVLLIDGQEKGLIASTKGWKDRGVEEPTTTNVVRGSKEGFSETIRTNTALIRRRIKDVDLRIDAKQIGSVTKTDVAILYMQGIADEKVIEEVHSRLESINIDAILESGYLEEFIQDETYTPFPTVYYSERPDEIVGGILEGRVAIIVDGTPFVLLVPALFIHFFQSSEDYYQRFDISTLVRILRFMAFFMALLVPSIFIAITTYHQEMIPTTLLISLGGQREGVPFPAIVEAILMEINFEILREAGIRMPKAVGSAISIVGALVIGEAAVQAGFISAAMVIVVSITAISSFIFPSYNMSFPARILRFVFIGLAGLLGLFGICLGLFVLTFHLCSLRSFGAPYMSPLGPFVSADQKDSIFRFPHRYLFQRPKTTAKANLVRLGQKDTGFRERGKR
jgi:spore germination protein KA